MSSSYFLVFRDSPVGEGGAPRRYALCSEPVVTFGYHDDEYEQLKHRMVMCVRRGQIVEQKMDDLRKQVVVVGEGEWMEWEGC